MSNSLIFLTENIGDYILFKSGFISEFKSKGEDIYEEKQSGCYV